MKKIFYFIISSMLAIGPALGQNDVYQFPNPDFESWTNSSESSAVPAQWHTFNTLQCDLSGLAALGCGTAQTNHSNRVAGYDGSGYAYQIYATSVLGVIANGSFTTGRIRVRYTEAGNGENYNYDPDGYRWTFNGRPDSISFYAKKTTLAGNALFKVFIHDGNTFYDRANSQLTGTKYGEMVISFAPSTSWGRFVKEVTWTNTTALPQLIIASFSTNVAAGAGAASDKMELDHLRCIYDKQLASLSINGQAQSDMLAEFNGKEYLTHDGLTLPGTNSGTWTINYDEVVCSEQLENIVTATAKSSLISNFSIAQPSVSNPNAVITVTHTDNSTFVYTIHFTNIVSVPTSTVVSAGNVHSCCVPDTVLLAATDTGSNFQWYDQGVAIPGAVSDSYLAAFTDQNIFSVNHSYSYTYNYNGCPVVSDAYDVVSIYVAPVSNATVTPATLCGGGTVNFSTSTSHGQYVVWMLDGNVVSENMPSWNRVFTDDDTAGTYNYTCFAQNGSNGACRSTAINVPFILYSSEAVPAAPVSAQTSYYICGGNGQASLTADVPSGVTLLWYDTDSTQVGTGVLTVSDSDFVDNITFYAAASIGECESVERLAVTVYKAPVPTVPQVTGEQSACAGSTVTLTATVEDSTAICLWNGQEEGLNYTTPELAESVQVIAQTIDTISRCSSEEVTIDITVNPTYEVHVEDSVMRLQSYTNYGLNIVPEEVGELNYTFNNFTIDGCDSTVYLTLHVFSGDGVEDYRLAADLTVYPNPTVSVVSISGADMMKVSVYNENGNLVEVVIPESESHISFSVSGYVSGQYLLKIELQDGRMVTKKMIKR